MFYVSGNELYIAGGNIYCEMQVKRHPITEILKLKIDMLTKKATVEKIQIEYGEDINMSSGTMTKKGNKLYIFGGLQDKNDGFGGSQLICSGKLYCINLSNKKLECLSVPVELREKCKVYGSSSVWFKEHTLVIISGTRPALGHGFRSIFSYSKHDNREMRCDSSCCIIENVTGNIAWVMCDICNDWVHNFCDPMIRKRLTPLKKSEKYICQNCRNLQINE
jgi:hypothetical protein